MKKQFFAHSPYLSQKVFKDKHFLVKKRYLDSIHLIFPYLPMSTPVYFFVDQLYLLFFVFTRVLLLLNSSSVSKFLVFMLLYRDNFFQMSLSQRYFKNYQRVYTSWDFSSGSKQRTSLANLIAFFKLFVVITWRLGANGNLHLDIVG